MKKIVLLLVSLFFISLHQHAQQKISQADYLLRMADSLCLFEDQFPQARELARQAQELYKKEKNLYGQLLADVHVYRTFRKENDYETAREGLEKILKTLTRKVGVENLATAITCYELGICYLSGSKDDNPELSLEYLTRAQEIFMKVLGDENVNTFLAFNTMGNNLIAMKQYEKAENYYMKAREIGVKVPDNRLLYFNYAGLGDLYMAKQQTREALLYDSLMVEDAIRYNGLSSIQTAKAYGWYAEDLYKTYNYSGAIEYSRKASQLNAVIYGKEHSRTTGNIKDIALSHYYNYDYDSAIYYFQWVYDLYSRNLSPDDYRIVGVLDDIGRCYLYLNDYLKAREYLTDAMNRAIKIKGKKSIEVANFYNYIGRSYLFNKEYQQALEAFNASYTVAVEALGEKCWNVSSAYDFMARTYAFLNDYDKALFYGKKYLSNHLAIYGENSFDLNFPYNALANTYYNISKYDSAIILYKKALALQLNYYSSPNKDLVYQYKFIANSFSAAAMYDSALVYYAYAAQTAKVAYGPTNIEVSYQIKNMANMAFYMGDLSTCMYYLRIAQQVRIDEYGYVSVPVSDLYQTFGYYMNESKVYDSAYYYYDKSLDIRLTRDFNDPEAIGNIYYSLGIVSNNLTDYRLAIKNYLNASEYFNQLQHLGQYVYSTYEEVGRSYYNINNNDSSIYFYKKSMDLQKKMYADEPFKLERIYNRIAFSYYYVQNYDSCLHYWLLALEGRENVYGRLSAEYSDILHNIALSFELTKDYDNAFYYYQKSLQVKTELYGARSTEVEQTNKFIADVLKLSGKYYLAIDFYNNQLKLNREINGDSTLSESEILRSIGSVYNNKGVHDTALIYYQQALEHRMKILKGELDADIAIIYNNIGFQYSRLGNFNLSREYYYKDLALTEKFLGHYHPNVLQTWTNLASDFFDLALFDSSLYAYKNALEISKKVNEGKPENYFGLVHDVGLCYWNLNMYDSAIVYYMEAIKLKYNYYGEIVERMIQDLNDLGTLYRNKRLYQEALEMHHLARVNALRIGGYYSVLHSGTINALANDHYHYNQYDSMLYYFKQNMYIRFKVYEAPHQYIAYTIQDVGLAFNSLAMYDSAVFYDAWALAMNKEIYGERHPEIAKGYNRVGWDYSKFDNAKAIPYLQKAVEIQRQVSADIPRDIKLADYYRDMGRNYKIMASYDSALYYLSLSLNIKQALLAERDENLSNLFNDIGGVYYAIDSTDIALMYYEKAKDILVYLYGPVNENLEHIYYNLALLYRKKKDNEKTTAFFKKHLAICLQFYGSQHDFTIDSYYQIAKSYKSNNQLDSALFYFYKSLGLNIAVHGYENKTNALTFSYIGDTYSEKERYDSAFVNYHKSLHIRKKMDDSKQKDIALASSYYDLGYFHKNKSKNIDSALIYLNMVLDYSKDPEIVDKSTLAQVYDMMGGIYLNREDYKEARKYYNLSIRYYGETFGARSAEVAVEYYNYALAYNYIGEYDSSIKYNLIALDIRREVLQPGALQIGDVCLNVGVDYISKGNEAEGMKYYREAMNIYINHYGYQDENTFRILGNVGNVYRNLSQYDSARYYLNLILYHARQMQNPSPVYFADAYTKLGFVYQYDYQFDSSLAYFHKALSLYKETYGNTNTYTADAYFNVAEIYTSINKLKLAWQYYDSSMIIYRTLKGEESEGVASVYYSYGYVRLKEYKYYDALDYYQQSFDIRKKIWGEQHKTIATVLINIADVYTYIYKYNEALDYYFKAMDIRKRYYDEESVTIAYMYLKIANVYTGLEKFKEAIAYQRKSIDLYTKKYGADDIEVADVYRQLAGIFQSKKEYDSALYFFFIAEDIAQKYNPEDSSLLYSYYKGISACYLAMGKFEEATRYMKKSLQINRNYVGEKSDKVAWDYFDLGNIDYMASHYKESMEYLQKAEKIWLELFGKDDFRIGHALNMLGLVNHVQGKNDIALEYHDKSLKIAINALGERCNLVATNYMNLGNVYSDLGKKDLSLEYYLKSMDISKELYGENHSELGGLYINIALIYGNKGEYDYALEYFEMARSLYQSIYGNQHEYLINIMMGIGEVYSKTGEFDKAVDNLTRAVNLAINRYSDQHQLVANGYEVLGNTYGLMKDYQKALENHQKSYDRYVVIFGGLNFKLAAILGKMAEDYNNLGQADKSFELIAQAISVLKQELGPKHPAVAEAYITIAGFYKKANQSTQALKAYHHSLIANLEGFNDTNFKETPALLNYSSPGNLLEALHNKAKLCHSLGNQANNTDLLNLSLQHYLLCDTMIDRIRQSFTRKSDKIAIGDSASIIYDGAVAVARDLYTASASKTKSSFAEYAFYFAEKNKGGVLLEALAGVEAQKFAGIPDNLLKMEQQLTEEIAFFQKELATKLDSVKEANYKLALFKLNQEYNNLIASFERDYPDYFNLKYSSKTASIKDIQKLLDKNTAFRSYFLGEKTLTSFTLTKKELLMHTIDIDDDFFVQVEKMRNGIIYGFRSKYATTYQDVAYLLYQKLFADKIPEKISNLIVIPDGSLGVIPFEALLMSDEVDTSSAVESNNPYQEDRGVKTLEVTQREVSNYKGYPFLIRKYNISYSYSANLFYRTFPKKRTKSPEFTNLNDWLALAPVFSDETTAGITLRTRELLSQMEESSPDTNKTRGTLFNGEYVAPIPGTEEEVVAVYKEFEKNQLKAQVKTHEKATEDYVKSGDLSNYKYLHIATHGFVNSEKPELSGILLAFNEKDTSNDGILHSGEIYNLKLNSDLVVLSACETGLGKISKGEGIIGLSRALLYAGTKNIIVSLWKVADKSTSDLMIDFYKSYLVDYGKRADFADALRDAKLQMINEGTYAHPYYWSPFVLIGK